jgi:hypothetical protein
MAAILSAYGAYNYQGLLIKDDQKTIHLTSDSSLVNLRIPVKLIA